ncbi:carboxypeptidase regulatory-like domain-containing protein [Actinobacillus seminis]|uniref:carboxypeptidase regulatory-like domain-containing protein n=1 Tax=Actinobacillus seminis TaxID=722 RepID=UPI003B95DB47
MKFIKILTALLVLFSSQSLWAHSLYLFAQYDGKEISGKAYYSDLSPAVETYVAVYRQDKTEIVTEGQTDKQGEFHFPLQGEEGTIYRVEIEAMEGHKAVAYAANVAAQADLTSNRASSNRSASNTGDELMLVRADIAKLQDKIYFRDILGGIGYIVGFLGLWAWWQSRRQAK